MSGIVPDEGEQVIANLILKQSDANRGNSLQLGLFTNGSIGETTVLADLIEPTGGGYARKTLVDAQWVMTGSTGEYAKQIFMATGGSMTGTVRGYFVCTTGLSPKILAMEIDASLPAGIILKENDEYKVTPRITVA